MNNLLLEGPDKAFGHPIGMEMFEKREAGADTLMLQLA